MTRYDAVVVGSGPAGYTAAVYLGRAGRSVVLLEGGTAPGGALMTTPEIENYPGFPDGAGGPELMDSIRRQALRCGATLVPVDAASVELTGAGHRVVAADGTAYDARALVLATGAEHRRLGIDGEDRLAGRGVSWCGTCDGPFFAGRDVVVVGGGDTAVEEACFLSRIAGQVHLVHRSARLRASRVLQDRLATRANVTVHLDTRVRAIEGTDRVTGVRLDQRSLPVAGVFVAIGHDPRSALVAGAVETTASGHVVVEHPSSRTNVPGVFACGDLVDPTYRQAITAAGSGCVAALDADAYLAARDTTRDAA
ncbi:MAG: FAD-dependent oxidoreductase [Nocardioidaceae bacterium]|nr:FAD-dependent oxidoreductase [Nocardioidaceae bacterium]